MSFQTTNFTNSRTQPNSASSIYPEAVDLRTNRSSGASGHARAFDFYPLVSIIDSSSQNWTDVVTVDPVDDAQQITSSTRNADGTFSSVSFGNGQQFQYQYAPDDGSGTDSSHRVDQITTLDSSGDVSASWYKDGNHWSANVQPGNYKYQPGSRRLDNLLVDTLRKAGGRLGNVHIANMGISNVYVDSNGLPQYSKLPFIVS